MVLWLLVSLGGLGLAGVVWQRALRRHRLTVAARARVLRRRALHPTNGQTFAAQVTEELRYMRRWGVRDTR